MDLIAVFVGLMALGMANMDPITNHMVPIEPAMAEYLSSVKFSLEYGEDRSDVSEVARYDPIATRLVDLMEDFRGSFETGTETMPPLDPYTIADIGPLHFEQPGVITGTLNVQNMETRGLKEFVVENLTFSLIGMTLRFSISVPKITGNAQYQLESQVADLLPYNPSGDARLQIEELSAYGYAGLSLGSDGFFQLSSFEVHFDFDYFDAHIDGVIGDGLVNSYFNAILSDLVSGVLNEQKDLISEVMTEVVRDYANKFIGQYRLSDVAF